MSWIAGVRDTIRIIAHDSTNYIQNIGLKLTRKSKPATSALRREEVAGMIDIQLKNRFSALLDLEDENG